MRISKAGSVHCSLLTGVGWLLKSVQWHVATAAISIPTSEFQAVFENVRANVACVSPRKRERWPTSAVIQICHTFYLALNRLTGSQSSHNSGSSLWRYTFQLELLIKPIEILFSTITTKVTIKLRCVFKSDKMIMRMYWRFGLVPNRSKYPWCTDDFGILAVAACINFSGMFLSSDFFNIELDLLSRISFASHFHDFS